MGFRPQGRGWFPANPGRGQLWPRSPRALAAASPSWLAGSSSGGDQPAGRAVDNFLRRAHLAEEAGPMTVLRSYTQGQWRTPSGDGVPLRDAVTGEEVARVSSEGIDM